MVQDHHLVLIGVAVLALAVLAGWWSGRARRAFVAEYGDVLPPGSRVRFRTSRSPGFVLVYPRWTHARKDGQRDGRRAQNPVLRPPSQLLDGELMVTTPDPFRMYSLVLALRARGAQVPPCAEEHALAQRTARAASLVPSGGAGPVFGGTPAEFEEFCARMFRSQGYDAQATGAGADGGVDVRMSRAGRRYVVECKLYASANGVGRPLLQKLVGAQHAEGAHGAVFVTTSFFTRPAAEYGARMGIEMIDGQALSRMAPDRRRTQGMLDPRRLTGPAQLRPEHIWAGYPADLRRG